MRGPLYYIGGSLLALLAALFLVVLLALAARASWSLRRGRRCRDLAELAARRYREGDIPGAVHMYLKAESCWALNQWDGGPESWVRDLDRLAGIMSGLVRVVAREPGTTYSDFNATIREMRDILRERRNFGLDGRKMLPDVSVRWNASVSRLYAQRKRLRAVCDPKLPQL
jgi:hypothetical protein